MAAYDVRSSAGAGFNPPGWIRILLGVVLVLAGIIVLGDVVLATIVSALVIGALAMIAGAFEVIYAFWTRRWGGFGWQVLLGVLYFICGLALVSQPILAALTLTFALGLALAVSGFVRIVVALNRWRDRGWIMLLSGVFGVIAGLIILTGFPRTGLWVLGFLLGIDFVWHGIAWLTRSSLSAPRTA